MKKLSTFKIYLRALRFTWMEIPLAILAYCAYMLTMIAGGVFVIFFKEHSQVIMVLTSLASLAVLVAVSGWMKQQRKLAMTGFVTQCLRKGIIPKKTYRESMKMVEERFESSTVGQLFKGAARVVFQKAVQKKVRSEILVKNGKSLLSDFRAILVMYGMNFIPYLGTCVLGYIFDNKQKPMIVAACDGMEGFFKNRQQMLSMIVITVLASLAIYIPLATGAFIPVFEYGLSDAAMTERLTSGIEMGPIQRTTVTMAIMLGLGAAYLAIQGGRFLVSPMACILILKQYFACCDQNPPAGKFYRFLPQKVQNEVERSVETQTETERKWLVDPDSIPFRLEDMQHTHILQQYTSFSPTTRIRNINHGAQYILTIKSKAVDGGLTRDEYEFDIPKKDYEKMLKRVKGYPVEKDRYIQFVGNYRYEFDIFCGNLKGLAYMEVEFASEEDANAFVPPGYVLEEVSRDYRYNNSSLARYGRVATEEEFEKPKYRKTRKEKKEEKAAKKADKKSAKAAKKSEKKTARAAKKAARKAAGTGK